MCRNGESPFLPSFSLISEVDVLRVQPLDSEALKRIALLLQAPSRGLSETSCVEGQIVGHDLARAHAWSSGLLETVKVECQAGPTMGRVYDGQPKWWHSFYGV